MTLSEIENAILKTIVYYDCLDWPLNFKELKLFLFYLNKEKIEEREIKEALNNLKNLNLIESQEDFYFLKNRKELLEERFNKYQIAKKKWQIVFKTLRFLKFVPYLRIIFASGSLAFNNAPKESDLDLLIVTKFGRIWLTRFLLVFLTSILRVRRKAGAKDVSDKICLNHFITDKSLFIPWKSIYTSQLYSRLVPIFVEDKNLLFSFFKENSWIGNWIFNWPEIWEEKIKNSRKFNFKIPFLKFILEKIFNTRIGDLLEKILRWYQKRRIERNPLTYEIGGRVIATDYSLEFHPRSPEKTIIEKYNKKMLELGFPQLIEEDSGLKK